MYSFRISFCVVPRNWSGGTLSISPTVTYMASMIAAVALDDIIEVLTLRRSIPWTRARMFSIV